MPFKIPFIHLQAFQHPILSSILESHPEYSLNCSVLLHLISSGTISKNRFEPVESRVSSSRSGLISVEFVVASQFGEKRQAVVSSPRFTQISAPTETKAKHPKTTIRRSAIATNFCNNCLLDALFSIKWELVCVELETQTLIPH